MPLLFVLRSSFSLIGLLYYLSHNVRHCTLVIQWRLRLKYVSMQSDQSLLDTLWMIYKNPSWVSMQDREISPKGYEFQPGMRLAKPLVEIPTMRVTFPYPAWTGPWWILFLPPLSGLFSFSPTFKWIVPRSCEIDVSHMGKRPISYRHQCEKMEILIRWHKFAGWSEDSLEAHVWRSTYHLAVHFLQASGVGS